MSKFGNGICVCREGCGRIFFGVPVLNLFAQGVPEQGRPASPNSPSPGTAVGGASASSLPSEMSIEVGGGTILSEKSLRSLLISTEKVLRSRALPVFKKLDSLRTFSSLSERFSVMRIGSVLSSVKTPEIMMLDMEVAIPPRYARSCSVSRWIARPPVFLDSKRCSFLVGTSQEIRVRIG